MSQIRDRMMPQAATPQSDPAAQALLPQGPGCILAQGSAVLTAEGALPVEYLEAGDRIVTRAGMRRILAVIPVATPIVAVRITASALNIEQPEDDLVVGADTLLRLTDWRARALGGGDRAVLPARMLVDGEFIRLEPGPLRMWRLVLDGAAVIYAGGAEIALEPVTAAA